jgi:hypothetical protein
MEIEAHNMVPNLPDAFSDPALVSSENIPSTSLSIPDTTLVSIKQESSMEIDLLTPSSNLPNEIATSILPLSENTRIINRESNLANQQPTSKSNQFSIECLLKTTTKPIKVEIPEALPAAELQTNVLVQAQRETIAK